MTPDLEPNVRLALDIPLSEDAVARARASEDSSFGAEAKEIVDQAPAFDSVEEVLREMEVAGTFQPSFGDEELITVRRESLMDLVQFVNNSRPRDGIGWRGQLGEAIIESETALFDAQVAVDRDALETLCEWVEFDPALDAERDSTIAQDISTLSRKLAKFSSELGVVSVDRDRLTTVLEFVKDDAALDSAAEDADILSAIRELEASTDESAQKSTH